MYGKLRPPYLRFTIKSDENFFRCAPLVCKCVPEISWFSGKNSTSSKILCEGRVLHCIYFKVITGLIILRNLKCPSTHHIPPILLSFLCSELDHPLNTTFFSPLMKWFTTQDPLILSAFWLGLAGLPKDDGRNIGPASSRRATPEFTILPNPSRDFFYTKYELSVMDRESIESQKATESIVSM